MKNSKKKPQKGTPARIKNTNYQTLGYEITSEPIIDRTFQSLPRATQEELNTLFSKIQDPYHRDKTSMVSRLEELVIQYPHVPQISNYLAASYQMIRSKKAKTCVEENYIKHPDYLFARIDYARICLERRNLAKIKDIFKEGFDLKLIYPQRNRFHVTEFVAFNFIMCIYFRLSGELESAKLIAQSLEKVAPEHPVTEQVKRMTKDTFLNRLRNKLYKFQHSRRHTPAAAENKSSEIQA